MRFGYRTSGAIEPGSRGNSLHSKYDKEGIHCIYMFTDPATLNNYFRFVDINNDGNMIAMYWSCVFDPNARVKNHKAKHRQTLAHPAASIATHVNILEIPLG